MKIIMMALTLISSLALADLTIYTDRPTANLRPIADKFTKNTGINVQIVEAAYPALKARIETEQDQSPADLIFVKDLIYLNELAQNNWFQKFDSEKIISNVPVQMRSSKNLWTGISFRVRTLVYNSTNVNPAQIENYSDLARNEWAGKVCVRTSNHAYNHALVSSFIDTLGEQNTVEFLKSLVANLAVAPMTSDRAVIDAIASGQCEIGLVNHYYLAPYVESNPAYVVKPLFLNQKTTGVHTNGAGMGIYKKSKNVTLATQFMEYMLEDTIQLDWSKAHYDYPVKKDLIPSSLIKNWGSFNFNQTSWENLGQHLPSALKAISDAEYK